MNPLDHRAARRIRHRNRQHLAVRMLEAAQLQAQPQAAGVLRPARRLRGQGAR